jgi:hypothetical protein
MAAKYGAAIDHGTTSARCILFTRDGRPVAVARREQSMFYPQPGWVALDMAEVRQRTCQDLGRELRHAGHPGVLAPCAALDGHWNLAIFGARRQIDWRDRPALARTIPAAIVAVGRPAPGFVRRVQRPAHPASRPRLFSAASPGTAIPNRCSKKRTMA